MNHNFDIVLKKEELGVKFNFRVAIIIIKNDKLLIQKLLHDNYYVLVGGRVQFSETTEEAIIRETEEEVGIKVKKNQLLLVDVVENFFECDHTKFHELLFIYRINLSEEAITTENFATLDNNISVNVWHNINELDKLDLRPTIAKDLIYTSNLKHEILK